VPAVSTDKPQFADDRPALSARFEAVNGLAVDPTGIVWVADRTHVRMYSPLTNTVSTACFESGNPPTACRVGDALAVAVSSGEIFVADSGANQIIRLTPQPD
jgi:streptogramin lyase